MSVIETVLIFVVLPAAILGGIGLATMRVKFAGTPRYRPGQEWGHQPMWWSANPNGAIASPVGPADSVSVDRTTLGGARGSW